MPDAPATTLVSVLDLFANLPDGWTYTVTNATHHSVTHDFPSYPELTLTGPAETNPVTIEVTASFDNTPRYHGYRVTSSHHDGAVLNPKCKPRRLASLTHDELLTSGTSYETIDRTALTPDEATLEFLPAASLAWFHAATIKPQTDQTNTTPEITPVPVSDS